MQRLVRLRKMSKARIVIFVHAVEEFGFVLVMTARNLVIVISTLFLTNITQWKMTKKIAK
jgi:hypothetical protein